MTGSEKGHNSMPSGELDEQGRHRHSAGTWTPQVRKVHTPAHAAPEPAHQIPPLGLLETSVLGLRKFDLGTVPAPVTPPPSWRQAALFAVGASLAVVFGLAFAAATLVGKPKNTDMIDALPGYPSLPSFMDSSAGPDPGAPPKPTAGSRSPQRSAATLTPAVTPPVTLTAATPVPSIGPMVTVRQVPPSTGDVSVMDAAAPAPPVRQTTAQRLFASNDPQEIGDQTEAFYQKVTGDLAGAYQMTTGELRLQGEQSFRQRYAGIRSIQVRQIDIDPNQGTTVSEVEITRNDGGTIVERRELTFSSGGNPKISSEVAH
ncbi:MAG: hypothetical protein ABW224_19615 [Kibdelosporangium sp.]